MNDCRPAGAAAGAEVAVEPAQADGDAVSALLALAMPVVVIGAAGPTGRSCATGTGMYVSLRPTELAVALHPGSRTTALIRATGAFSVSILASDQADLAVRAGHPSRSHDEFAALRIPVLDGPPGVAVPGVAGCLAVLWCEVVDERQSGDHVLIVGTVVHHIRGRDRRSPLLRLDRRYAAVGDPVGPPNPDRYPV